MSNILKRNTLSFTSYDKNSNKYYTMELHENSNDSYVIFTEYGRIGQKSGKQDKKYFSSYNYAISEYEKILKSKLKKGYTEKDLATYNVGSQESQSKIEIDKVIINKDTKINKESDNSLKYEKLHPLVEQFIKQIFDEANSQLKILGNGTFTNEDQSPLGKLSINQINEGRSILSLIAQNKDKSYQLKLCEQYFQAIPRVFGSKISINDIDITSEEKLAEQAQLLDFYEEALKLKELFDSYNPNNIAEKYNSLNCDIIPLNKDSDEYKNICNKIRKDESPHHNIHISVKNIFAIKQNNGLEFDDSCKNVKRLYHGTRSANIPAILASHLKMPKALKGVYITGAMFGPGIYFASASTKSTQYSCATLGGKPNKHKTAFLFIADVALGKIKEENYAKYYNTVPDGYNSVKGCKGVSLLHDEYIIYNEKQQRLKYIVEFDTYRRKK